jgi:hypothetical protein
MFGFLSRLGKDRRGNALIIAGACLPLVVGAAGLATDTIQWALWKRQLQRAADSAALAGGYARVNSGDYSSAVTTDLTKNNHLWMGWASGYPQTTTPSDSGNMTNQVQVSLGVRQTLGFTGVFLSTAPLITATARAASVPDGSFCVVGLESSTTPAVTIGGSANVNLGCGVISNSVSSTASIDVNGNSYTLVADPVAGAGGLPSSSLDSHGGDNVEPYHIAEPDPFASKYPTDVPSGTPCNGFSNHTYNTGGNGNNAQKHLTAGCYSNFNAGNNTYYLDAGTYYLDSTSISLNGQTTLIGSGVTLIFTGTSPGTISMNGSSSVQLTAPTSGTYAKMLMIQSSNASNANTNLINGDNGSYFDGAIYFPKGDLSFTGSSSSATKCAMIVGLRVHFNGNTDIQNNTTGCTANQQTKGWKVRIVA